MNYKFRYYSLIVIINLSYVVLSYMCISAIQDNNESYFASLFIFSFNLCCQKLISSLSPPRINWGLRFVSIILTGLMAGILIVSVFGLQKYYILELKDNIIYLVANKNYYHLFYINISQRLLFILLIAFSLPFYIIEWLNLKPKKLTAEFIT